MNIVKELEDVLKQPNFMGETDKVGVNLAVNAILDKIDKLGFDLVKRSAEMQEFVERIKKIDEIDVSAIPEEHLVHCLDCSCPYDYTVEDSCPNCHSNYIVMFDEED